MRLFVPLRRLWLAALLAVPLHGASATEPQVAVSEVLDGQALDLQRDIFAIDARLTELKTPNRIRVVLDIDDIPQLTVENVTLTLNGTQVMHKTLSPTQLAPMREGGMITLYDAPLPPGPQEMKAAFTGNINRAYESSKLLHFDTQPGTTVVKLRITDLLQQRQPEFVYQIERRRPAR